ncbi:hypothetical protein [Streptomyces blattellae]|nr:hypothetical protein [Streptomyces blattellae]
MAPTPWPTTSTSSRDSLDDAPDAVREAFGPVQVVVTSAGVQSFAPVT